MTQAAPQHWTYNDGGTVQIYIPTKPAATQTVSCYSGGGAAIFETQAASVSTAASTLNAAVSVGDASLTVSNGAKFSAGEILKIGGIEDVLVKSISSNTVNLYGKTRLAHANAGEVAQYLLTYTVSDAQAATEFHDGRLEWLVDDGTSAEALYVQACSCTRYPFQTTLATWVDLADEEPRFADVLDTEVDVGRLLQKGAEDVRKHLDAQTQGRGTTWRAPVNFTDAVVYAALKRHYRSQRDDVLFERYKEAFTEEMETVTAAIGRDADLDGKVEAHEQRTFGSRRIFRG